MFNLKLTNKMETKIVYVVTSYGKIVGCYADSKDAFDVQMLRVNKGQLAELVPCPIVPSTDSVNLKS